MKVNTIDYILENLGSDTTPWDVWEWFGGESKKVILDTLNEWYPWDDNEFLAEEIYALVNSLDVQEVVDKMDDFLDKKIKKLDLGHAWAEWDEDDILITDDDGYETIATPKEFREWALAWAF